MEVLLIFILLLIAILNAYVILWGTTTGEERKKYSKIWHSIGLALRVLVYIIPFFVFHNFWDMIKWTLLFVSIGGVAYDFIINAIRYFYKGAPPLFYVDNKGWNKFFLKYLSAKWHWILRGVFVLGTIIYFVI